MCWIHFYFGFFSSHDFIDLFYNWLSLNSSKIFWKALVIVITFLSFKGISHAFLLKISKAHNKKWIPLLHLLINCISARSAPHISYIKGECNFLFINFLIIASVLWNTPPLRSYLFAQKGPPSCKCFHFWKRNYLPTPRWIRIWNISSRYQR